MAEMEMKKRILLLSILISSPLQAKRLSDWLIEQKPQPDAYPLGLSWSIPAEKASQNDLKYELLKQLTRMGKNRLKAWVSSLPVTGRVPVANADARWLQANPTMDPVIRPEDAIELPKRPVTVTVVTPEGRLCRVIHSSGLSAGDYVRRCNADSKVDYAFVAEPDGKTRKCGISLWNTRKQDEPAPGSWIWAPSRGISEEFSEKLIAFLATQGPAKDSEIPLSPPSSRLTPYTYLLAPSDLPVTANDWGEAGLLQSPTARMRRAGDLSFTLSRVYPYTRGNIFLQPFDWMEAGFRYTNISNRLYGPVSFSGSQAYKDKSIDVKFRLEKESVYVPELSLGFRDIAGTGLFSGEYFVGSKRTGPLDWSLGMGWGYVGGRADLGNPIGRLIPSFDVRKASTTTGNFALGSYFHGPAAAFGGVQYQTPWEPLILKLEYDGNNYQNDPMGNILPQNSPWNFGVLYRWGKNVDISTGIERGNTAMLSITFHSDLDKLFMPKLDDPPPVPVRESRPKSEPDWKHTVKDLKAQSGWQVSKIERKGNDLAVTVDDAYPVYWKDRLDKAVSVLHRDSPADIDEFSVVYRERGTRVAEHDVDRESWVKNSTQYLAPSEAKNPVVAKEPQPDAHGVALFESDPPLFDPHLGMNFNYYLGGPNGFVFYQFAPSASATLNFSRNTWLQGGVQYDVLDNYNHWVYDGPSLLPRVRTYVREYMTTSRFTMPNLQLTHVGKLTENQYWSVYGGYLEMMFAGVGGEWLYRPFAGKTAIGVDVNEVQQRDFAQNFNLRNYRVLTGHGTLYWDTGWQNVLGMLSFGRYLAGDIGATIDFSKAFDNGVRVGAFFTKTNVSAQQFGEGSFDKGIYLQIPFDAFLTKSSDTVGNFVWKPVTRDGGAMLARQVSLYDVTSARGPRALQYQPVILPDEYLPPENRKDEWKPKIDLPPPPIRPKPDSSQWQESERDYRQRLTEELYGAGFRNIRVSMDGSNRLSVFLSNENLRPDSLAVGRAARIVLAHAPLDVREIRISFAEHVHPDVIYDFFDPDKLKAYFDGKLGEEELRPYVAVQYVNPTAVQNDPLAMMNDMTPRETTFSEAFSPDTRVVTRVERDVVGAAKIAAQTDWVKTGAIGAGLILGSSLLDKGAYKFALNHASNGILRNFDAFGNALPWVESAGAALSALGSSDPELSRTGYAASEAAVTSFGLVLGLKTIVGRARPYTGQSNHSFHFFSGSSSKGTDGFPSGHAIAAWSVLTPFAEEYHMPWLYGLGVITDLSRVGSRNHWVSDTVAGSFLGYGIGKFFWESSKLKDGPHVFISPYGVDLSWDMQ